MTERLQEQEDKNTDLSKARKKIEQDVENLKKQIQDLELTIRKQESEKQSKDNQIKSLQVLTLSWHRHNRPISFELTESAMLAS